LRIPPFIDRPRKISKHRDSIDAALGHYMPNALLE